MLLWKNKILLQIQMGNFDFSSHNFNGKCYFRRNALVYKCHEKGLKINSPHQNVSVENKYILVILI